MKLALVACAAALALSGCQTLTGQISPTHAKQLQSACASFNSLKPTYDTLVAGGVLSAKTIKTGNTVINAAGIICSTPADATYADVLAILAQAAVMAKILKDAE